MKRRSLIIIGLVLAAAVVFIVEKNRASTPVVAAVPAISSNFDIVLKDISVNKAGEKGGDDLYFVTTDQNTMNSNNVPKKYWSKQLLYGAHPLPATAYQPTINTSQSDTFKGQPLLNDIKLDKPNTYLLYNISLIDKDMISADDVIGTVALLIYHDANGQNTYTWMHDGVYSQGVESPSFRLHDRNGEDGDYQVQIMVRPAAKTLP